MILTKIEMHLSDPSARADLRDVQRMHQLVTGLFQTARQDSDILYRVRAHGAAISLYMYSSTPVEQSRLLPYMLLAGEKNLGDWLDTMESGQLWSFDLLTMPSKKVADGQQGKNSRRCVLRSQEERLAWLGRKAEQNGFAVLSTQEQIGEKLMGAHPSDKGGRLYLDTYCYTGTLQITDAEKFRTAVTRGIGPEKAYGLGMLLLKR